MNALRPYQVRAIEQLGNAILAGSRSPLVVGPTGMGKTRLGEEIVRRHLANGGKAVLWLAHRKELLEQAADAIERSGNRCSIVSPGSKRFNPHARVQVASIQTLLAREGTRPVASLLIFDEAHHYVADEFRTIADAYPNTLKIGFTATPERGDGRGLGEMFDSITVAATVRELTELGFLVPCEVIRPRAALGSGEIAARPVDAYLEHASGRQTIVFCQHVMAAEHALREFQEKGVRAGLIVGTSTDRTAVLAAFKTGKLDVLVNVFVLTEGFDHTPTSCVILARGCGTAGTYLQMVGRALRIAPNKKDAVLIDLRGVSHVHGNPDEDRIYSLSGRAIRRADEPEDDAKLCKVCGAIVENGACSDCGIASSQSLPTVVNSPLVKFAKKRAEGEEERVRTLARWMKDGEAKGYKPGWALGKFRAVYGCWPDWPTRNKAAELTKQEAA